MSISIAENCDCMEAMTNFPDKYFELAIVDPVFGELVTQGGYMKGKGGGVANQKKYNKELWQQEKTNAEYFTELKRISKNQIVWGGNYFSKEISENSSCWIVWDKQNGDNGFADCELAYTSFKTAVRIFRFMWSGMLQGDMSNKEIRIHPTQKPVALYKWLLKNYAKPNDKILDCFLGSGSSRIACYDMGFDFWGYELDPDYFTAQEKRFKNHISQERLFVPQKETHKDIELF